jgi:hypothetical protein
VRPAEPDANLRASDTPTANQEVPPLEPGGQVDVTLTLPVGLTTAPLVVELLRADGRPLPDAVTIDVWSRAR